MFSLSKLQQDRALDLISQMEEFLGPLRLFQLFTDGLLCQLSVEKESLTGMKLLHSATRIPFVLRFTQDLGKQDALHLLPVSKPKCLPGALCCVPGAQPARAPPPCALGQVAHGTVQWVEPQSQPTFLTVTRLDEWASLSSVLPPAVSTSPSTGWAVSSVSSPALFPAQILLRSHTECT